jgi:hypothetical protein
MWLVMLCLSHFPHFVSLTGARVTYLAQSALYIVTWSSMYRILIVFDETHIRRDDSSRKTKPGIRRVDYDGIIANLQITDAKVAVSDGGTSKMSRCFLPYPGFYRCSDASVDDDGQGPRPRRSPHGASVLPWMYT